MDCWAECDQRLRQGSPNKFEVDNGVTQGNLLSRVLFRLYGDIFLSDLSACCSVTKGINSSVLQVYTDAIPDNFVCAAFLHLNCASK